MAQPKNTPDREYAKFIDSPTRPNQSAVETVGLLQDADGDKAQINPDGSLNVKITNGGVLKIAFDEVSGVVNGVTTQVVSLTALVDLQIKGVLVNGDNIAMFEVLKDSSVVARRNTYFGVFGSEINLDGFPVLTGETISVDVTHYRPHVGAFDATIKYFEV
jgi:hypothetical protein